MLFVQDAMFKFLLMN
jgi:hypothetical protein